MCKIISKFNIVLLLLGKYAELAFSDLILPTRFRQTDINSDDISFRSRFEKTDDSKWEVRGDASNGHDKGRIIITNSMSKKRQTLEGASGDSRFGESFSMSKLDGKYLAIGSWSNDTVYVYTRNRNNIYENSQIITDVKGVYFGYSVSFSDDGALLAIAAPYKNSTGPYSGSVNIYERNQRDTLEIQSKINGESYDKIGKEMFFKRNGDYLVISSPYAHNFTGHVDIFQRIGNQQKFLLKSKITGYDQSFFGYHIDATNDFKTLIVYVPHLENYSAILVYELHMTDDSKDILLIDEIRIGAKKDDKAEINNVSVENHEGEILLHLKRNQDVISSWMNVSSILDLDESYSVNKFPFESIIEEGSLLDQLYANPQRISSINFSKPNLGFRSGGEADIIHQNEYLDMEADVSPNLEPDLLPNMEPDENDVPKTVDIFIIAGENNVHGQAAIKHLKEEQKKQDGLFYTSWHDDVTNAESTQHFSEWAMTTKAGWTRGEPSKPNLGGSIHFGPELGFVHRANQLEMTNNRIAILKYAVGKSCLTKCPFSDWDLSATGTRDGDCWRGFKKALSDATSKLKAKDISFKFRGMIWWQGESGTSIEDLKLFTEAVRELVGTTYEVEDPVFWPIVITEGFFGKTLKAYVADQDTFLEGINAEHFGQKNIGNDGMNTHIGSGQIGSFDETGTGNSDMWDIGEAYADKMKKLLDSHLPDEIDIFIIAGQSNAHGYAVIDILKEYQLKQETMFYTSWHWHTMNAATEQYFSGWALEAEAGWTHGETRKPGLGGAPKFGPELGFAYQAKKINLTKNPLAIIKYGVGGTCLTQCKPWSDWDLDATGEIDERDGDCWRGFKNSLADSVAKLKKMGMKYTFRGMVWWQGETGTSVPTLNRFIKTVRDLLGEEYGVENSHKFPFVITECYNTADKLKGGVAASDWAVELVNARDFGQGTNPANNIFTIHPGSGEQGALKDKTGTGNSDMWDIGLAYADKMKILLESETPKVIDIFIIAGQNNAEGYASIEHLKENQRIQKAFFYTSWHTQLINAESTQYFSGWASQVEAGFTVGKDRREGLEGTERFGPEFGFVSKLNELQLTRNNIGIFKYAMGNTCMIACQPWSDWDIKATGNRDGDCWRAFKRALEDATSRLEEQGVRYNFKGMIWWQGESGTTNAHLGEFIKEVRRLMGSKYGTKNSDEFPIVITTGYFNPGLQRIKGQIPFVEVVDSNEFGQGMVEGKFNIHVGSGVNGVKFDTTGTGNCDMWDIGEAYADKIRLIMPPDTDPPSVSPTIFLTLAPSSLPSAAPTLTPTMIPSNTFSEEPSEQPTEMPSLLPSTKPTVTPTEIPTATSSITPSKHPSSYPSSNPSSVLSFEPTFNPTNVPTIATMRPTVAPTTVAPTKVALTTVAPTTVAPTSLGETPQPSEMYLDYLANLLHSYSFNPTNMKKLVSKALLESPPPTIKAKETREKPTTPKKPKPNSPSKKKIGVFSIVESKIPLSKMNSKSQSGKIELSSMLSEGNTASSEKNTPGRINPFKGIITRKKKRRRRGRNTIDKD